MGQIAEAQASQLRQDIPDPVAALQARSKLCQSSLVIESLSLYEAIN